MTAIFCLVVLGVFFQNCSEGSKLDPEPAAPAKSSSLSPTSSSVLSVDLTQPANYPKITAPGQITVAGRVIDFKNGTGNATNPVLKTVEPGKFYVTFTTASGRIMNTIMSLSSNSLNVEGVGNERAQFCMSPLTNNPCGLVLNNNNVMDFNCGSALYWTGAYTGDTTMHPNVRTCP